jgi:hypothetical protein
MLQRENVTQVKDASVKFQYLCAASLEHPVLKGLPKMLGQILGVSFPQQNKGK